MNKGFIFVNEEGNYAYEGRNIGFGSAPTAITWTSNINEATIFHSTSPWENCMQRHLVGPLRNKQALQAVATRVVKLTAWNDNSC